MPSHAHLDHVVAAMRGQVATIHAHETGARRGRDPEQVHRMRVAVRRLRAILRAGRALFPEEWVDDVRRQLDWLGSTLGRVRDLDVLRAHLRAELGRGGAGGRAAGRRLLARVSADRERASTGLRAALAGRRYARLLARLDAAMKNPPLCAADVSLSQVAAGEFDRLRRAVKRLPEQPSAGDLHAIRIKIKRARFAAELAQPVAGRPSERFIGKAKHLQDVLGEHQDAVTAQRYLRRTLGTGPAARRLAAQLIGRQQERREAAREAFARQWPKLKRRGQRAWG